MTSEINYLSLLENPIAFHRVYAEIGGGAAAGVFISQLVYWHKRMKLKKGKEWNGWLYKTAAEWEVETCTTRRERENAEKALKTLKVLETARRGIPSKKHYRLNETALNKVLEAIATSDKQEETGSEPSDDAQMPDIANKDDSSNKQESQKEQTTTPEMASKSDQNDKQECQKEHCNTEITSEITQKDLCASGEPKDANVDEAEIWVSKKGKQLQGKKLEVFKQLWDAYANKHARANAIDAYLKTICPMFTGEKDQNRAILENLLKAIQSHVKSRANMQPGQTVLYFEGWISQRRWEDEYPDLKSHSHHSEATASPVKEEWQRQGFASLEDFQTREGLLHQRKFLLDLPSRTAAQEELIRQYEKELLEIKARRTQ